MNKFFKNYFSFFARRFRSPALGKSFRNIIHTLKILESKSGFTVIELILTSLLISIFAVGVVVSWDLSQPSAELSLLKVAQDIRYAQNRAIITGIPHGFRTTSTTQYEIYQGTPGNPTVDPSTRQAMTVDLGKNFPGVFFQGNYQIQFNDLGTPTQGGGTILGLAYEGASRSMTVINQTGAIRLH